MLISDGNFIGAVEAIKLVRAFLRIKDARLRRAAVGVFEALLGAPEHPSLSGRAASGIRHAASAMLAASPMEYA